MNIDVIYIAGWGHSGSTLLARLLDTAPQIASYGELKYFLEYCERDASAKIPNPFYCSCGADFHDCGFWTQVRRRMLGAPPPSRCTGIRARCRAMAQFFSGAGLSVAEQQSEFALLQATIDSTQESVRYLLDASKDFTRLMRLLMIPGVSVIPIYLVRDVRGVAHSYRKALRNDMPVRPKPFPEALVMWWLVHVMNLAIFKFARLSPIHVSYADLCSNPSASVARLNRILGTSIVNSSTALKSSPVHYLGGNTMKSRPISTITEDEEWRAHETRAQRLLYSLSGIARTNRRWALHDPELDNYRVERPG